MLLYNGGLRLTSAFIDNRIQSWGDFQVSRDLPVTCSCHLLIYYLSFTPGSTQKMRQCWELHLGFSQVKGVLQSVLEPLPHYWMSLFKWKTRFGFWTFSIKTCCICAQGNDLRSILSGGCLSMLGHGSYGFCRRYKSSQLWARLIGSPRGEPKREQALFYWGWPVRALNQWKIIRGMRRWIAG